MGNKERNETINELYGSVQDTHNYGKTYYYQQAKEIAAVTAIAMIRDGVPPVDIRICIDNWYGVEIPEHAMKILEAEAKSDEEEEQLTGKRRTDLSPSSRYSRCWDIRKVKRLHEYSISPDVIHCTYPDLSETEIENICSNVDDDGTKIDDLTLRKLQETVKTPLKTTEERVSYLRDAVTPSTHRQMNDEQLAAAGIPAGLIRISCGLEDKNDLIADIAQALDAI